MRIVMTREGFLPKQTEECYDEVQSNCAWSFVTWLQVGSSKGLLVCHSKNEASQDKAMQGQWS